MRNQFHVICLLALGLLIGYCALPVSAQEGGMSLNSEIVVVPAPGQVTIDGKTDDWDLSAGVWSYNDPTLVEKYSVWTHMMWDSKGVYFLARYADKSPMQNSTQGKDFSKSWQADAYQARVIFDDKTPNEHQMHINMFYSTPEKRSYMIIKHGGFKAQAPFDETGPDRPELAARFGSDMDDDGGKIAYREWDNKKGYNVEAFWPWSYVRLNGQPLKPGEEFVFGIEAMWGNGDGTMLLHRLADGIKNDKVNRIFMFRARSGWGRAVISATGNKTITADQQTIFAIRLKKFVDYDSYGSIPITFTLPDDRDVTIAIDNAQGKRIRNLFGQYPRKAGTVTDKWDGLDDNNKPVPPGKYTVTIVDHKPVELKLVNSVYNSATPPWKTDTAGDSWGSNHGYPTTVATQGNIIIAGFTGTEGTSGIVRCGPDGVIKWADKNEILDAAIGEKYVYTISRDSWIKQTVVRQLDLQTGQVTPFADAQHSPLISLAGDNVGAGDASSIAISNGMLYVLIAGNSIPSIPALGPNWTPDSMKVAACKLYRLVPATGAIDAELPLTGTLTGLIAITDRDGKLYGLYVDGSVARINADATQATKLFTGKGLTAPKRLGVSHDEKKFAISDGATNQVFVFDAKGKLLQTIGKAYTAVNHIRPAGKFIETNLIDPLGLDFDAAGRLWIAEAEGTCKRVSTWSTKGKLLQSFWGSADYGAMSGFGVTYDSTRFIAHGIEFKLDPNPNPLVRPTIDKPLIFHPELAHIRGLVYKYKGFEYAVTAVGPSKGTGISIARRDKSGAFRICARLTYGRGASWVDKNGDFIEDPDETTTGAAGSAHYWSVGWVRPDLTIVTGNQYVYKISGLTKDGVPLYDFANAIKPKNTIAINMGAQGSTGTVIMDMAGNISNGIAFNTVDGHMGSYPNLYQRHDAPAAQRGVLIAPFRTNGVIENVPGVGSVTALGGDRGEWFLLSMDGLYLSSILQDSKSDVTLDDTFVGQESFGGFFWRDETPGMNGRVLAQLGGMSYRIMEVKGLETTRKAIQTIDITQAQIDEGERIAAAHKNAAYTEPVELHIAHLAQLPTVPVAADLPADQPLIAGAPDFRVEMAGDTTRWFRAAMAQDGKNLAIMYRVTDQSPWKNGEGRFTHLFIGGDAVDLKLNVPGRGLVRLLAAPLSGVDTVAYWQKTAPVKDNPQTYVVGNNAGNASTFDITRILTDAQIQHKTSADGYSVLITVPLAELGIDTAKMSELNGTIGIIMSDPAGKNRLARLYWFDKQTDMVSDVPTESRLFPERFGKIILDK